MYPTKTEPPNIVSERDAEIPSLLCSQRARLEEQLSLIDRLHSKLEPVMSPSAPLKGGGEVETPALTVMGNLIDRANQEISSTNYRLREILERLAI